MELCIKNMIFLWIRVSNKENWWARWSLPLKFTQLIRNIEVIISKNGTSDKESFMTEFGPHISLFIKLKMPIKEYGLLIFQRLTLTLQVLSIIHITCWLGIITIHHSAMMFQKVDSSTLTSITWLLQCLHNYMMEWLNMMMVYLQVHLKWLMMFQSIWLT